MSRVDRCAQCSAVRRDSRVVRQLARRVVAGNVAPHNMLAVRPAKVQPLLTVIRHSTSVWIGGHSFWFKEFAYLPKKISKSCLAL